MKQDELMYAVATGIFLAIIGVMTLIFVLWLYSPLLIPLALTAQSFVVLYPDLPFAFAMGIYFFGVIIYLLGKFLIWLVDLFLEWRIKVRKSRLTNLRKDPDHF